MKKFMLLAAVLFTAVCGSFNYNQGKESELSDFAKANIKALSKDGENSWPCIEYDNCRCLEWVVLSCGVASPIYYPGYVNFHEEL